LLFPAFHGIKEHRQMMSRCQFGPNASASSARVLIIISAISIIRIIAISG